MKYQKLMFSKELGKVVPYEEALAADHKEHYHYVVSDEMTPTMHPIDGRVYESKSAFRAVTKAHGCYEVGNDYATAGDTRKRVLEERRAQGQRERTEMLRDRLHNYRY